MSLFSAIQQSATALSVGQLGLQVVGNNVANINTPGYIRQELVQGAAQGYRFGGIILGQGVEAIGVRQQIDYFLVDRLRGTQSQLSYQQNLVQGLHQLQEAMNELGENDISSALSRFNNSLQEVANNPQNLSIRSLAVQRGEELAYAITSLRQKTEQHSQEATAEIAKTADDINQLLNGIAQLNLRIVEIEGGQAYSSDAVGLREERLDHLSQLSELVDLQVVEQSNGSVTVLVGGDYVVSEANVRPVDVTLTDDPKMITEVRLADTDAPLRVSGGKLRGLYERRSSVAGDFQDDLDEFTSALITTVNRIHSQGQSSVPLQSAIGTTKLTDLTGPLEQSAPSLTIDNGSFNITVLDASTNLEKTHRIDIRQLGDAGDTSASGMVTQIDAISGIKAAVGGDGLLRIEADSPSVSFYFSEDSSGTLAALGINTFFTGSDSSTIKVRPEIQADTRLLAISRGGPGNGAENALAIAEAFLQPQANLSGLNLRELYEDMVAKTTQTIESQETVAKGLENYRNSLEAKHLGITGVSLDEEAAKLLQYQRAFQASSRVIAAANELLETLVNLV